MAELAGLFIKIEGDASGLIASINPALAGFTKLNTSAINTAKTLQRVTASNAKVSAAFGKVSADAKITAASTIKYSTALKSLNAAASTGQAAQTKLGSTTTIAGSGFRTAGAQVGNLTGQIRTSRFHTANLSAQFNDIGVQFASGQSPFTLAIQQGTQITQVLQTMGGTGKQQLAALKTAFTAIISPTALLVIGLIAGTVALGRWAFKAIGAVDNTNQLTDAIQAVDAASSLAKSSLEILTLSTEELTDRFGDAGEEARRLARDIAIVSEAELRQSLRKSFDRIQSVISPTFTTALSSEITDAVKTAAEDANLSPFGPDSFSRQALAAFSALTTGAGVFDDQNEAVGKLIAVYDQFGVTMGDLPQQVLVAIKQSEQFALASLEAKRAVELALSKPSPKQTKEGKKEDDELERLVERIRERAEINRLANEEEFIRIQEGFFTRLEAEEQFHADRLSIIEAFGLEREENEAAAEALREQEVERHNNKVAAIEAQVGKERLRVAAGIMGGIEAVLAQGGDKLLKISKIFGAARALINAWIAFSEVLKDPTLVWWQRIPAALGVLAAGLGAVNAIRGVGKGGSGQTSLGGGGGRQNTGQVAQQQTSPTSSVNIALRGQNFDRGAVIGLIEQINEAVGDGARIRSV